MDVLCGEEIVTQYLVGQWKERRETEGDTALWGEDEQPKTLLQPTYLALNPFLKGGLTYLPNTTKKKATRNRFQ